MEHDGVGVAVDVDEARGDNFPPGVYDAPGFGFDAADFYDLIAGNGDVRGVGGRILPVDDFSAFDDSGIPRPPDDMYSFNLPTGFTNPSSTVMLDIPYVKGKGIYMDRKILVNYLISLCENAGVKFIFGAEVMAALTEGERAVGIRYRADGEDKAIFCDLVIDAAGMHSKVRKSLPLSCNIKKELQPREIFHVHRVYFENTTGELTSPQYIIKLFHMNRPGIDWVLTEEGFVDILVGKFGAAGELTQGEIDEAITALKKQYPFMGEKMPVSIFAGFPYWP